MPQKKKSLFRQPGAKHFQLVHRSQRDPLINDPEASKHVLKEFEPANAAKKGKSLSDLESLLPSSQISNDISHKVGQASLYGIYYDDTEYDYMQHLREVGVQEDGVESVLIEAPTSSSTSKDKGKGKAKESTGIMLKDEGIQLPPEALPSQTSLPLSSIYTSSLSVEPSLQGLQPDMDPHLRQVLEALEDDAFVDDEVEDDFFGELVKEGERDSDDEQPEQQWEFEELGIEEGEELEYGEDGEEGKPALSAGGTTSEEESDETTWEDRFKAFKKSQASSSLRAANLSDDEDDNNETDLAMSEGGDTIGSLRTISMSVIGGKKRKGRRAGAGSDASGYSMSSSSMFRNDALQTLDERFDQMMMKEYDENDSDSDEDTTSTHPSSDPEEPPTLLTSRDDFESMMNDFLNEHELLGRKMRPKLAGDTGPQKLDTLRRAMGLDDRVRVVDADEEDGGGEGREEDMGVWDLDRDDGKGDRWDCETILSTYSNLENHPRIIRARGTKTTPVTKIKIDPRTGFPVVLSSSAPSKDEESDSGSDTDTPSKITITRPKDETPEEKRARKAAVKATKQARRVEKKTTKEQFGAEIKKQMKSVRNKETATRLRKL